MQISLLSAHQQLFPTQVSLVEIYNDTLVDLLLDANATPKPLNITSTQSGIVVTNLTSYPVTSVDDIEEIMIIGDKNRSVAATKVCIVWIVRDL